MGLGLHDSLGNDSLIIGFVFSYKQAVQALVAS
jgi:hypothetical protein